MSNQLDLSETIESVSTRLNTEVIHRSEGDVATNRRYNELYSESVSKWSSTLDAVLKIDNNLKEGIADNGEAIAALDRVVNTVKQTLLDQIVKLDVEHKSILNTFDERVRKYEIMLSDITADSHQITADNGQVPLGAWTILSRARTWDLEILLSIEKYKDAIQESLDKNKDEILENLPNLEDWINDAISGLSQAPVIKELDEKLNGAIADIDTVQKELIDSSLALQEELVRQAEDTAKKLLQEQLDRVAEIKTSNEANIEALEREANIRKEQLLLEAQERSLEIEAKLSEHSANIDKEITDITSEVKAVRDELHANVTTITTSISAETAARIEAIGKLNDGLTVEIQSRKDGDNAITTALNNYKASNDSALANVQEQVEVIVTDISATAKRVDALDVRMKANETATGEARTLAASAVTKAETALTETSALASRTDSVEASISSMGEELSSKVDTIAFNQLKADVTKIDGKVTSITSDITAIKTSLTDLDSGITANLNAINELKTTVKQQGDSITLISSNVLDLSNSLDIVKGDVANKVDSSAFNQLKSEVTANKDAIESQSSDITELRNSVTGLDTKLDTKADATVLSALTSRVEANEKGVTSLTSSLTNLTNRVSVNESNILKKADAAAVTSLTSRVDVAEGKITSQGAAITRLTNDLESVGKEVATKADSSAVTALDSKVSEIEGKVTANSNSITSLNSRVSKTEKDIALKADASALNNIYTKAETDAKATEIAAGELSKYDASLSIGNDNMWQFSNAGTNDYGSKTAVTMSEDKQHQLFTIASQSGGIFSNLWQSLKVVDGAIDHEMPVSFSLWVKAAVPVIRMYCYVWGHSNPVTALRYEVTPNEWTLVKIENMKPRAGTNVGTFNGLIGIRYLASDNGIANNNLVGMTLEVKEPLLQYGSKVGGYVKPSKIMQDALYVNSTAIENINTEVKKIGDNLTTESSKITALESKINDKTSGLDSKASTTAVNTLDTKVTSIEGKVTANTNSITSLNSRVTKTEKDIALKADASALSNIYTKSESDAKALQIAAGEINKYDASLVIGGANLYYGPNPVVLRDQTSAGRIVFVETASGNTQRFNYLTDDNLDLSGLQIGDPTIASIEIFVPSTDTSDYTIQFGTYRFSGIGYIYAPTVDVKTLPKDTWVKLTTAPGTYTSGQPATGINLVFNLNGRKTAGDELRWRNFMMEKASKSSAFSESDKAIQKTIDANATAIQNTNAEVKRLDGKIEANSSAITTLTGRVAKTEKDLVLKADTSALDALTTRVSIEEGKSTAQGTRVTELENKINHSTTGLDTKASSKALTTLDSKVTTIDGRVTSNTSQLTQLSGSVDTLSKEMKLKVDSSALNSYYTKQEVDGVSAAAAAGAVSKFTASLSGEGVNLFSYDMSTLAASSGTWAGSGYTITRILDGGLTPSEVAYKIKAGGATSNYMYSGRGIWLTPVVAEKGVKHVISIYVKSPLNKTVRLRPVGLTQTGGASQLTPNNEFNITANTWTRISVLHEATSDTYPHLGWCLWHNVDGAAASDDNYVLVTRPMLERTYGDRDTPSNWVEGGGVSSGVNANANAIQQTNTEVSRIDGVVKTQASTLTSLKTEVDGKASNSSVTSLTSRVTTAEGKITSLTQSVTTLENKVNSIDGTVAGHTKTINILSGQVTDIDGKLTAQSSAITKVESNIEGLVSDITVKDTRDVNNPPDWYWKNYPKKIVNEFKRASTIGVTGLGTYVNLETRVYYGDNSGGAIIQYAYAANDSTLSMERNSSGAGANAVWVAWRRPIDDIKKDVASKASSAALNSLESKVTTIDGKVTAHASTLTQLQASVNDNTAKLVVQGKVVDGLKGEYTVKIDVNGLVTGYGLYNDGTNSAFGVNADFFFVGKGTNKKKPFIVVTTPTTIGGVTYPAGVWIDAAFIAKASIGTAQIEDLAVTTGKLDNLAVTTAKIALLAVKEANIENLSVTHAKIGKLAVKEMNIDDLAVTTLKIQDEAVTVPSSISNENIFTASYAANFPSFDKDFESNLAYWENAFGDIATITINRAGGKVRFDATLSYLDSYSLTHWGGVGGSLLSAADANTARAVLSIYRGTTLVGRSEIAPTGLLGNNAPLFQGTYNMLGVIDTSNIKGPTTYTLRFGFGSRLARGGEMTWGHTDGFFKVKSPRLIVTEMKK